MSVVQFGHWVGLMHPWNNGALIPTIRYTTGAQTVRPAVRSVRYARPVTISVCPAGCNYPGDYIGDTPYQAAPTTDCTVQDTCPGMRGNDPVHNMVRSESCFSPTAVRWD